MFKEVQRYGFINAKLKTRLSLLLSPDFFNRLSRCPTLSEAMILLKDTEYSDCEKAYKSTGDLKMAELALLNSEIRILVNIQRHVDGPVKEFVNALLFRYEIENFKHALRLWFDRVIRKRDTDLESGYLLRTPIISNIPIDKILSAGDYSQLCDCISQEPYHSILEKHKDEVEAEKTLFSVEIALDMQFYQKLQKAGTFLHSRDKKIIDRMIGVEIDMENITRLMRFHYFYKFDSSQMADFALPGGFRIRQELLKKAAESPDEAFSGLSASGYTALSALGSVKGETANPYSRMELIGSLLGEILKKEISKMLGGNPFTIGIILSYFILKRQEIRRLSAILNGIYYKLPEDRMRRLYT